ncbi:hypothetical protein Dimus_009128 [Dionaea muscipula]
MNPPIDEQGYTRGLAAVEHGCPHSLATAEHGRMCGASASEEARSHAWQLAWSCYSQSRRAGHTSWCPRVVDAHETCSQQCTVRLPARSCCSQSRKAGRTSRRPRGANARETCSQQSTAWRCKELLLAAEEGWPYELLPVRPTHAEHGGDAHEARLAARLLDAWLQGRCSR